MTPQEFAAKWAAGAPAQQLGERAGAQAHFIDLCRVLGVPEPGDPATCCFERSLTKTGSAAGRRLADAHAALDAAVAAAYGWADWTPAMPDDEILRRLLALNRARARR